MKNPLLLPRAVRGFFLAGLALLLCSTAGAATLTVNATTDTGTGTGTTGDLRYCVAHANAGDTITFASTLSGATITLGSEIVFPSSANVSIDGSGLATAVIISGNNAHRLFTINSGSAVLLKVLSLTAGNGTGASNSGNGGAIYNNGLLNLNGCTLYSNSATGSGGAILNTSSLIMVNCTIASNTAASAGGISHSTGSLILIHCTVADNTGGSGAGGIVLTSGTATLENSIVAGNTATSTTDVDLGGSGAAITMTGNNLIGQNSTSYNTGKLAAGIPNASGDYVGTNGSPVAANLLALGSNGGPVQTMSPSATSNFVIDKVTAGNVVSGLTTDACGNARSLDGDADGVALPDIGAVEYISVGFLSVSTTQDTGVGSLRQAVANAAQLAGPRTVTISFTLNFQTITLASAIAINNPAGLTIDGSGISISGAHGNFSLFTNASGSTVTFRSCALINGGALSNQGTMTLDQCTLAGNTGSQGGALLNGNTATLVQCTLSGNSASNSGGAIFNQGTLGLVQCTVSANTAASQGGAIFNASASVVGLTNCLVGGNTAPNGPDIFNAAGASAFTLNGNNFVGSTSGSGLTAGSKLFTTATKGPINLAPLGNYGGFAPTMPPLVGSPAIDAADSAWIILTTDQRGDNIFDGKPDLGAVEANFQQVTNTNPSGFGSLSAAISNALSTGMSGRAVSFASNLSGQTITLSGTISLANGMIIDGGGLTNGVTISGAGAGGSFGLFTNAVGSSAFFNRLTLANGGGSGFSGNGGAIQNNNGTVILSQCILSGNSSGSGNGGAIENNSGSLTLNQCTLSGNSCPNNGGAIENNSGTATLTQCTLSGNSTTSGNGGGIDNQTGTLMVNQCTLSGNTANGDQGGGIANNGTLNLNNSVVSDNTAGSNGEIYQGGGTYNPSGTNIITTGANLAVLGNYGGPTQTMPPLPGSAAINAASGSTFTTDQRGCPIVGIPDAGAAECAIINPSPGESQGITTLAPTFTWTGPAGATFALAIGTSPSTLSVVGNPGSVSSFPFGGTLLPNTTYFWQVNATVGGVTFAGPQFNFTTPAFGATTVLSGYAMLNGSANPGGVATTAYFQYGTSTAYGSTSPVMPLGSGNSPVPVSFNASGLAKGTTYHYRLVTVSGGNTVNGQDQTFTTSATTSPPNWHSAQITALTNPALANMADGARTGAAQPNANLYFYKGTDNNIWAVFLGATTWGQQQLSTNANVSDWLAYEPTYGILCYKSIDGNLWCVYYSTAAKQWTSLQLGTLPQGVTIAGDLVVDSSGGWNNIYYRGSDSHLYAAYFNGSAWVHLAIGGTATVKGNLAVQGSGHLVYYQSTDNNIWCFYNNGKTWSQLQLTTTGNVGSAVAVDNQGFLAYYKSNADTSAWCTYPSGANWNPVQLDATANMNSSATSFSNIAPYNANDCTLYLDNNGQCDSLFWNGSKWTHVILGDGGAQLTGGLSLQPTNHWLFARRSDGNVIVFYLQ